MAERENLLKKLLTQIAEEQNFVNYDIKIEPISSDGANYTTALYNITVTENENEVYMFAKVAIMGEKLREGAPRIYEIESLAYTKILKAFERLQEDHKLPHENRLSFSKFYGYKPVIYEEIIVLENLAENGYQAYDRFKSIDWPYAKSALMQLAKMHALGFAFNVYYPEDFNEVTEELQIKWNAVNHEENNTKSYFEGFFRSAVDVIKEKHREKLRRFYNTVNEDTFLRLYNNLEGKVVLGHGDFRPSNLMHKIQDDGTIDIKIVDLQTMQGNCPVIDLLYFIVTGSDEEFRTNYYQKSLDHYFSQLQAAMRRLHLDPDKIYSREDFEYDLKEKLPYGLTMAAILLPVVTVNAQNAPEINKDTELSGLSVQNTSDLFTERMNGLVNDYVRWGILK